MKQLSPKTLLIKLGGSILEHDITSLCQNIGLLQKAGYRIIIVHGGSKAIHHALTTYGIKSEFINGLRVTSREAMDVIEMVLCGHVNRLLVKKMNHLNIDALGLSGSDQRLLLCDHYSQQHGFVGEIKHVNTTLLHHIMTLGIIPVISTIGVHEDGHALNINADMAACHIANAMKVTQVLYLTDQEGIYDQNGQFFSSLSIEQLQALMDNQVVTGGMLVKAKAVMISLQESSLPVSILNGHQENVLLNVVMHQKSIGTQCVV